MTLQEKKYLSDILSALQALNSISEKVSSFKQYQNDILLKAAAERFLSIAGEAANKYGKLNPQNRLVFGDKLISLRNRLVHAYDNIDDRIIWNILQKYVQPLATEIENLLATS